MGATRGNEPSIDTKPANSGRLHLRGQWTLDHALAVGRMLRGDFGRVQSVDVTGVERLDSAGVLQLLRFARRQGRSEEHTSELQSLMRISYAVFCLKKKKNIHT